MSWNNWEVADSYNHPKKRRFDEIHGTIDRLRKELAINDIALVNELNSQVYSDYDRSLIAAELYKERLIALTASSRAQMLVAQISTAVNYAHDQGYGVTNYSPPNQYQPRSYGAGYSYNNNTYYNNNQTSNAYRYRKNKRKAHKGKTIPVQISSRPGTNWIAPATTTAAQKTTNATAKATIKPVKTSTVPAYVMTVPAKVPAQAKATAVVVNVKNSALTKAASGQLKTTTAPAKISTAQIKTVTASITTTSVPVKATTATVKATTAPVKATNAPVKATNALVKASTAPVKANSAPVTTTSGPIKTTIALFESSTSAPNANTSATRQSLKRKANDTGRNIPSLVSSALPTINLQFAKTENVPLEPIQESVKRVKTEPIDDDMMYDDLADHI